MRLPLYLAVALIAVQSASAESLWRNFFTTNRDPIVEVVAGSNATVQATTVGVNLRRFTVNSTASAAAATNVVWPVAGTNITMQTNGLAVTINATGVGTVQTNISWTAVTNLQSSQVPYTVITNAPWQYGDADLTNWATLNTNVLSTLGQTNISYTAVTNAPWQMGDSDLTNWATLNTNVLSTLGQTNISYTAVTNAPWQYGGANLTNWNQLTTNVLGSLAQTNISYTAVTNAPWQYGSANLTNWGQLTTNVLGTLAQTNISLAAVTNAQNLTNWALIPTNYVPYNSSTSVYASLLTSTAIGLADTNWVLNQISSLGSYIYFGGPTNTFAITNSGETVARTNVFTGSISPFVNASTSTLSGLILNAYVRHVISTNTFATIEAGPVSITTYPFRTGGGTLSGHYEFYAVDAVSNIMYELASTPVITISATVPTEIQTTMLLTNAFNASNRCYVALAFKIDSTGAGGSTLSWAHGGNYRAHLTFTRPLSSATINASQITGTLSPTQLATNTPSASQVLTATSAGSAAWKDTTGGSTVFSVVATDVNGISINSTDTRWASIYRGVSSGTEILHRVQWPKSSTFTNFFAFIYASGAGTNVTCTVYTNGVASNFSVTLNLSGATTVTATNTTSSLFVPAGTLISVGMSKNETSVLTPTALTFSWLYY